MILMLSILATFGIFQLGPRHSLPQVVIRILAALGLDFIIFYVRFRTAVFSTSALISVFIIALALVPGVDWYIPVTTAIIVIGSKHIIRIKGKHIFNPAGFGLLISLFVFRSYLAWWGASVTWLLLILGLFITYRFKRFPLVLSFLVSQFFFLGIYYALKGQPILNALLMTNLFFLFVMLVEPKTSPVSRKGRVVYGLSAGILSSFFTLVIPRYDPSVLALASVNLLVPAINSKLKG